MAGKLVIVGLDAALDQFEKAANAAGAMAGAAVFDGAKVLADAIAAAAASLPVGTPEDNTPTGHPFSGLTEDMRAELVDAVGIAQFKDTADGYQTSISFDGYSASHKEKGYPNGVPLALIARSIESGSSVRKKHPFARKAVEAAMPAAEQAMIEAAQQRLDEALGKG